MTRRRRRSRIALAAVAVGAASSVALHALGGPDPLDIQQETVTRVEQSIANPPAPLKPERHSQEAAYVEANTAKAQARGTDPVATISDLPGGER